VEWDTLLESEDDIECERVSEGDDDRVNVRVAVHAEEMEIDGDLVLDEEKLLDAELDIVTVELVEGVADAKKLVVRDEVNVAVNVILFESDRVKE
jgi:hypothetical protein